MRLFALAALVASLSIASLVQAGADCSNGNFSGIYQDADVELSGDLFVTGFVTIRNGVTVTLAPGTTVTFCGEYQITTNNGGNLRAVGTAIDPIVFDADDPATKWRSIRFAGAANDSELRHVVLNNGGGNDPLVDAGTIEFDSTLAANALPSPTLDFVTVNDSGSFGMFLRVNSDDESPPSITNLAVNNSQRAAVLANAPALGGFGGGNSFTGNAPNTIQVIDGGASRLYKSQIWRNQGVPFEFLGTATVAAASSTDPFPKLTIREGVTFRMHPDAKLEVGTSLGRGASLAIEGTETSPVVFTRLDAVSAPWDKLGLTLYPGTEADIEHADFSFGGSVGPAMIEQIREGVVSMDQVRVANSASAGLHSRGSINVRNSVFEFNDIGLEFWTTADAVVRGSEIRNNATTGINSLDSGFDDNCIDAVGNYWGSPDGPPDSLGTADACGDGVANAGSGDAVSGGVRYRPWLPGPDPQLDRSTIQPESFYVIADGVDRSSITITLRDAQGNPVSGKAIELDASIGDIVQPTQVTDANGITTAEISATSAGFAYLSARNVTDNEPLAGLGGVTFWQGSGDAGGLIDPGGTPYASPQLQITGAPYQAGFPVGLSLPMQNSNSFAVDVEVVYGVSNFGIGNDFTPVYSDTLTLQPGETWNAPGSWVPPSGGHRCFQATITSSPVSAPTTLRGDTNTTQKQVNTDQDPCNPDNLDPGNALPKKPGGVFTLAATFYRLYTLAKRANECIDSNLDFSSSSLQRGAIRDYEEVVTPPEYAPPIIPASGEITQAQADVLNDMARTSADLLALKQAIGATAQRLNWAAQDASQSLGTARGSAFYFVDLQFQAFRDFTHQYADKLDLLASQIGDLLPLLSESSDPYFTAGDFQSTRDDLEANGFDTDTQNFYSDAGLSNQLIEQIRQDLIEDFDNQPTQPTRFSTFLAELQISAAALAARLRAQYPQPGSLSLRGSKPATVFIPEQTFDFEIAHPFAQDETVDLVVRPVNLPLGWSYAVSEQSVLLSPGETRSLSLTLYPSGNLLEGDLAQVVVEGYVNDELIGGTLLEYVTPSLSATLDLIFEDRFE